MINLVPKEEKKKKAIDFYLRFFILLFLSFGVACLVGVAFLAPAYFFAYSGKKSATEALATEKSKPTPDVNLETTVFIKDLNEKIATVENAEKKKFLVSQKIISEIILKKMPDIKIDKISFNSGDKEGKVSVYGTAPSRDRLLIFSRALEDSANFKKVDLPVSNFIKGSNIKFYIGLTPA